MFERDTITQRSFQRTCRSRTLSDSLARALLPPENESPIDRTARLKKEEFAKKISDNIDEQIKLDETKLKWHKKLVKIVLLGQSESGKSTTLKCTLKSSLHFSSTSFIWFSLAEFQIMHAYKEFQAERTSWHAVIYLNLIHSVRRILETLLPPPESEAFISASTSFQNHYTDANGSPLPFDENPVQGSSRQTFRKFEHYAQNLFPLLELEQRLTQQLAFPEEDNVPLLRDDISANTVPTQLTMPSSALAWIPNVSGGELSVRLTSRWKEALSFKAAVGQKKGQYDYTEERGWWEDPNDPGHILHTCVAGQWGIRALWQDSSVRMTLAKRHMRIEDSAGFYLDDIDRITALKVRIRPVSRISRARKLINAVVYTYRRRRASRESEDTGCQRIFF